ncbi:MAG: ATP-binding protein [Deltaproteobacteria bacterium]|nr:ATP-binding protein [Deltaproteobacteria bacterium]
MYIHRKLDLSDGLLKKSYFLFGPRQTGKTSLIQHTLSRHRCYNLLQTDVFLKLSRTPQRLRQEITPDERIVIIDEIQKLPILLDEVHSLIEEKGIRFLLTGSSARKLRNKGINLLGGRARTRRLHPLIFSELDGEFRLKRALDTGLIPSIYFSDAPFEDLEAYTGDYLKEEIAAEAVVRNIPAFSRFLTVAGLCNGKMINYTNIANDAQVPRSTVQEYFQILRDTLLGDDLPAWRKSIRRKPLATSKFYFFDIGVARFLQGRRGLETRSPEFGEAFESYIHHELRTYCDYRGGCELCYWRSTSGFEVDYILNGETAIEVKGKTNITQRDLAGLTALREEALLKMYLIVSLEDVPRKKDDIEILPWQDFLVKLWQGSYA